MVFILKNHRILQNRRKIGDHILTEKYKAEKLAEKKENTKINLKKQKMKEFKRVNYKQITRKLT